MSESLKKNVFKSLIDLYLSPVKSSNRLKRYIQEVVLMDAASHLSKPVQFLKRNNLISKRPVILDIGGENGDTTEYFLKLLPGSKVYNFEANPELASKIKERFTGREVNSYSLALSDKPGKLKFHITDNSYNSSYKTITGNEQFRTVKSVEVVATPLDSIMENEKDVNEIDIIKLDVQGAEADVICGASKTLAKTKLIIVEQTVRTSYEGASMYYEVDDLIRKAGFNLLDIIVTFRKDGLILSEYDSIYINNKYYSG